MDSAAFLENAVILTALLPAKLWKQKISPNPEKHISQSAADLFGSLFKGICTKVQLQSCERYIRLRTCWMNATGVYQSVPYAVLERKAEMNGAACLSHLSHPNV